MRLRNVGAIAMLVTTLAACGGGGGGVAADAQPPDGDGTAPTPIPQLSTFQSASIVIGQLDMTSSAGGTSAVRMNGPEGIAVAPDGRLFIVDRFNNRILSWPAVPTVDGMNAEFALGQTALNAGGYQGVGLGTFFAPRSISINAGAMAVADTGHNRVLVFTDIPDGADLPARVLGQEFFTTDTPGACNANGLASPSGVQITPGGRIVVADTDHERILVWNNFPDADGQGANYAIGQPNLTTCESQISLSRFAPVQVWTDGQRMAVATGNQNRVLLWDHFPMAGDVPADRVLGQTNGATTACNGPSGPAMDTLCGATAVASDGTRLAVWDRGNHRVLVWNTWPTTNKQPADVVLGQSDGVHTSENDGNQNDIPDSAPQSHTLQSGMALTFAGNRLIVSDSGNQRVLVFRLQ